MSEVRAKPPGSPEALAAAAFRQLSPELHQYLMRRIRRGYDVANLAMEIYERFMRAQSSELIANPRAFIFRIAHNAVIDTLRLEATQPVVYDSNAVAEAGERLEHSVPDSGDQLDAMNQLRITRQALTRLPPMHQAVLWLIVRDGLSHQQVAQRTGLSLKTVGVYLSDARARLRALLEDRHGR